MRELDDREGFVHVGRVSKIQEQDHFESFVARESVRFLKNHGRQQPFFLISSFLKPHDPFMPAERFAVMYKPEDMKLPDTFKVTVLTLSVVSRAGRALSVPSLRVISARPFIR